MKISQLLASILVLLAGGAAIMYSADQQKVMDAVIAAHGGGQQVDANGATGLRKLNQDLDAERGTVSSARSAAVKAAEAARVEMMDNNTKRDEAQAKLADHKASLAGVRRSVDAMAQRVEELRKSFNAAVSHISANDSVKIAESDQFAEVMEGIKGVVAEQEKRTEELTTRLNEWKAERVAATEKLAKEKVELNRLIAVNEKFFDDYSKNDDEYALLAVDARWKFVVFNVGPDSGLVPGDATPLLVKRGDTVIAPLRIVSVNKGLVVAEYNPAQLQKGIRPELGDRVFRVKPMGS